MFNRFKSILNFNRNSIIGRIMIGYLVIIVVPIWVIGMIVYNISYRNVINESMLNQQGLMNQSVSNIDTKLRQIEGIYQILQTNSQLQDYLNGVYMDDADRVFNYNKYINPLFNYIINSNDIIQKITIYKYDRQIKGVGDVLVDADRLSVLDRVEEDTLKGKGVWYWDNSDTIGTSLKYYKGIYNDTYSKYLAMIELDIKPDFISSYLQTVNGSDKAGIYFFSKKNELLKLNMYNDPYNLVFNQNRRFIESKLANRNYFYFRAGKDVVTVIKQEIGGIDMNVVILNFLNDELENARKVKNYILVICIILLTLFSFIYYFISFNISRRIINLAQHMKQNRNKSRLFTEEHSKEDEIGFLVESYNSMITENEELVNKVYKAEVLRKEAAYSALYAQVRPHFICNVLENIRMLAETNNDQEIVALCFKFSKLIRYSIIYRKEVSLEEEINNIRLFLDIQKIRFGPRLEYKIEIDGNTENFKCPWFLIQPLVENSIIHGIGKVRKKGIIHVKVVETESTFTVTLCDNGAGMTTEKLTEINEALSSYSLDKIMHNTSRSIGILNVYGRLIEYYGKESRITISSSENDGTVVEIVLGKQSR